MKNRLKIPLLLAPALTIILVFFVGGLVLAVMQSLLAERRNVAAPAN